MLLIAIQLSSRLGRDHQAAGAIAGKCSTNISIKIAGAFAITSRHSDRPRAIVLPSLSLDWINPHEKNAH
jgi:hypothetical protein